ncbi:hypothetical protein H8B06_18680 [Sphingobacterium sp. DN00404]|uniref:Uncharacterized protein n=1 Tax=Sphingobacterium micropteri TaxID=2763501 RepID=A0ABR7YUF5_9SPHI|nr:hypothetical protein [Sphingobacterium micropteri]MBD1434856.1 hypothetical protein [Sphingobacterium micropteri]
MKLTITNWSEINKALKVHAEKVLDEVAEKLFQLGLATINDARTHARFNNFSNNLRSSFAIAVALNGKIIKSDYSQVGNGTLGDGSEGMAKAKKLINEIVSEHRNQLLLVLVAGESYALYVEAKDNKTVLTQFALELKKKLTR